VSDTIHYVNFLGDFGYHLYYQRFRLFFGTGENLNQSILNMIRVKMAMVKSNFTAEKLSGIDAGLMAGGAVMAPRNK
jgi:hypothetical protein